MAGFGKHSVSQYGVSALTGATPIGWEKGVRPEEPSLAAVAARADQAGRMEVLLEPRTTGGIIEQIGYWKVYHAR